MELLSRPIRQIAYFTDDIRQAATRHSKIFGSGPFLVQSALCEAIDRGRDVKFESNYCVGQWGEVMVEFISATSAPTVMSELALEGRRQRFHHVALIVEDLDTEIARLKEAGYPLAHLGYPTEMPEFRFAFHDGLADLGMFIELYPSAMVEEGYATIRQLAKDWDGRDPVRSA